MPTVILTVLSPWSLGANGNSLSDIPRSCVKHTPIWVGKDWPSLYQLAACKKELRVRETTLRSDVEKLREKLGVKRPV